MKRIHLVVVSTLVVLLSACGGGGGSDGGSSNDGGGDSSPQLKNVASQKNGGTATASYDSQSADIVNDGGLSGTFWAGNADQDHVTVAFDQKYSLEEITIYTNATNNSDTKLQVSDDGQTFTDIGYITGSPKCSTLQMGTDNSGNPRIRCVLPSAMDATHVRVVITDSSASQIQIYEVKAMGS